MIHKTLELKQTQENLNSDLYCKPLSVFVLGWNDFQLFAFFKNGHISADQVYLNNVCPQFGIHFTLEKIKYTKNTSYFSHSETTNLNIRYMFIIHSQVQHTFIMNIIFKKMTYQFTERLRIYLLS